MAKTKKLGKMPSVQKKNIGGHIIHSIIAGWEKKPKFQIRSVFLRYKTMVFLTASKVHPGRRPFQPMIRDLHQANTCYSLKSRNRHAFFEKAMVGISRELNLQIVSKGIGLGYQWTHKRLVIDWSTRLLGAICNNYKHLEANDPNFIGYQFHLRFPP